MELRPGRGNLHENQAIPIFGRHSHFARTIGSLFLDLGGERFGKAEEWIQQAIQADGEIGMRWDLAMDHAVYGKFFERASAAARAREHLGNAMELFQECGADGWVKRMEERLTGL